ncbi:MAG: HDOD domain-containing protein [Dissulfurimicrobium sp.]|uniref:HDOD domain-containing protein n=1 Tax=Dissulfurimicrobium TaxID=1769732 RepID=UPI003C7193ED
MDIPTPNLSLCLEKINSAEWLPCPDQALSRCLRLFTEKDVSLNMIEEAFRIETSLCSQLLKVANSAFYGATKQIHDVRRAVMTIGLREAKGICLSTALMQQFSQALLPTAFDLIKFWRHSMLTSFIASELAMDKTWIKRDEAQLYGLLHDIGRLAMAALLPDWFNKAVTSSLNGGKSLCEAENDLGITHSFLGWALAKKWRLPEPVCLVIRWHHDPIKEGIYSKQAALIYIADYLANTIGKSVIVPQIVPNEKILSLADINLWKLQDSMDTLKNLTNKIEAFINDAI